MGRMPAIIKVETAISPELAVESVSLEDLTQEARGRLEVARVEAARIVAAALEEAEAIRGQVEQIREAARAEGHRAGFENGEKEGRSTGRSEALEAAKKEFAEQQGSLIESCQSLVTEINEKRRAWEASARQDLVDLAMAIGRRVARHVGGRDREVVLANLEETVQLAGARSEVTIAVHPADGEAARVFASSLVESRERWDHVKVVEDESVSPGGCRVRWDSGAVDASLETQLDRIEAALARDAGGPVDRDDTVAGV